ncbi:hypothetical protein PAGA_a1787 [Pseudoalteromonas agarivorans DSM 14585]|uniref:Uncharacterized protein n=1 Tax=Pseudoalteromonas agarivorans DSM 14585 TaxID=1312369 RepID=A0ACA8DVA5_9GAMM|nr:hypothetical protein PAGA_a1787 [Pseudoalteromonas agarivorans DSM 14585]
MCNEEEEVFYKFLVVKVKCWMLFKNFATLEACKNQATNL